MVPISPRLASAIVTRPSAAGELEDFGQRAHPVEPAGLEEGELRFDGGDVRRAGLDDLAAEARERVAGRNAGRGLGVELRIDAEDGDRVLRSLCGD